MHLYSISIQQEPEIWNLAEASTNSDPLGKLHSEYPKKRDVWKLEIHPSCIGHDHVVYLLSYWSYVIVDFLRITYFNMYLAILFR